MPYLISSKWAFFLSFFHWYFRDIHLDWKSNNLENLKLDLNIKLNCYIQFIEEVN